MATIILEHPTSKIADTEFRSKTTSSQKIFQIWERTISDISFEDKILLEKSEDDFKKGRTVSHKKIMKFLGV